jgi:ATP-binding cassette subfamily B protein
VAEETAEPGFTIYALHGADAPRSARELPRLIMAALRIAWAAGRREATLALARVFFRDAPFVILDEPTAALDARAEAQLFEALRTMLTGRSVLLISHRFSSVRSADRIFVLHDGRLVESGTHDELVADGARYAELVELQAAAYR